MGVEAPRPVAACTTPAVELAITEDLDLAAVPHAEEMLDHIAALHPSRVVIDMAACRFIDAAGIRWLLNANRQLGNVGGQLTVRAPACGPLRVLRLTGADEVLHIIPPLDGGEGSTPSLTRTPTGPVRHNGTACPPDGDRTLVLPRQDRDADGSIPAGRQPVDHP